MTCGLDFWAVNCRYHVLKCFPGTQSLVTPPTAEPTAPSNSKKITEKRCVRCKSSKRGDWRPGPDGPATYCNPCGIEWYLQGRRPSKNVAKDNASRPLPPPLAASKEEEMPCESLDEMQCDFTRRPSLPLQESNITRKNKLVARRTRPGLPGLNFTAVHRNGDPSGAHTRDAQDFFKGQGQLSEEEMEVGRIIVPRREQDPSDNFLYRGHFAPSKYSNEVDNEPCFLSEEEMEVGRIVLPQREHRSRGKDIHHGQLASSGYSSDFINERYSSRFAAEMVGNASAADAKLPNHSSHPCGVAGVLERPAHASPHQFMDLPLELTDIEHGKPIWARNRRGYFRVAFFIGIQKLRKKGTKGASEVEPLRTRGSKESTEETDYAAEVDEQDAGTAVTVRFRGGDEVQDVSISDLALRNCSLSEGEDHLKVTQIKGLHGRKRAAMRADVLSERIISRSNPRIVSHLSPYISLSEG